MGFTGNAAIGVSWRIILVVIVFISSLFAGMSVLVARFAGAGDSAKSIARCIRPSSLRYFSPSASWPRSDISSPWLLDFVNAAPR